MRLVIGVEPGVGTGGKACQPLTGVGHMGAAGRITRRQRIVDRPDILPHIIPGAGTAGIDLLLGLFGIGLVLHQGGQAHTRVFLRPQGDRHQKQ